MYKILLVDDDAINRVAITSMLDWESLGFEIVGTENNGKSALEFFAHQPVELIITDMKMPIMDGLELIRNIRSVDDNVNIIAISSYSDYELVRSAFKSNVDDYILKTDLSPEVLKEYLLKVKSRLDKANIITSEYSTSLTEDLGNNRILEAYYTFAIEICNYEMENQRFVGSGKSMLTQMEEVIGYIPQFTKNYHICAYTRSSILLCYHTDEIKEGKLQGICRQLIQVLKNYMNIKIYLGVSNWNKGEEMLEQSMDTAFLRLSLSYIFGKQQIFLSDTYNDFDVRKLSNQPYLEVIESLRNLDDDKLFEVQSKLFNASAFENEVEMKRKCLELIYFEGMMLNEIGDSIWNVWGEIIDFDEKINRLQGSSSMVMWIANYNRWIIDYLHNKHVKYEEANEMDTFCHYIEDNYANSDLSLNEVASIAGFNEKYFSSKFKKEVGVTFVDYLTNVRIEAAKKLLQETNMKLVAISESVGYNNVEHFVRVFKKKVGVSPREYAKSCR